jgi:signal transduction histidine kinase
VDLCTRTLDFTRDGAPRLVCERFDLASFVEEVGDGLLADQNNGTQWEVAIDDIAVFADRDQLYRVVSNISLNALQSGANRISIRARQCADRTEIDICDNGPGLPPRAQENLFRPFAGSARPGGSGLGLAIAREIMRAHSGDVSLLHTGGDGTVFRLILPVREMRPIAANRAIAAE